MKTIWMLTLTMLALGAAGQNWDDQRSALERKMNKLTGSEAMVAPSYYQDASVQLTRYSHSRIATIQTFDNRYEGTKGSPYLSEEWLKGAVMVSGVEEPQVALLNYDCLNDELLVRLADGNPAALPHENVASFLLYDEQSPDKYRYFVPITPQKGDPYFCEVLYSGRNILLVHPRKTFRKADYQRAYSPDRKYDEYLDESVYYLKSENGKDFAKLRLQKKQVLEALPLHRQALEQFAADRNLKLNTPGEVVQLLAWYDSL
ncbi:MAG TPA: hypothetical protein P5086_04050 [Prolixibacteraceae bacterium]|nr:hypothetical protein [Bacteroidales bacterium]HNQ37721.1 hypothetical protein [Prolixibacteraceae bacterium]HOY51569.1 hypothetical protein [Prolixibacteraceae bacterium]HPJ77846.1 hypothetical protein [Prolixibacteraceae bacterium]HRV88465.1 hypothetical protein [Prolixibacteraceae bacterium]